MIFGRVYFCLFSDKIIKICNNQCGLNCMEEREEHNEFLGSLVCNSQ